MNAALGSKKQVSASLVNFAAVADVMEMDEAEFRIKFVDYAIIIHAEFEFHPALQS